MREVLRKELFGASTREDESEVDGRVLRCQALAEEVELREKCFADATEADDCDEDGFRHCDYRDCDC